MKRGVVVALIVMIVLLAGLTFFLVKRFGTPRALHLECQGDPDYAQCVQMEARAQKCLNRPDEASCLRELGLQVDEPELNVTVSTLTS